MRQTDCPTKKSLSNICYCWPFALLFFEDNQFKSYLFECLYRQPDPLSNCLAVKIWLRQPYDDRTDSQAQQPLRLCIRILKVVSP